MKASKQSIPLPEGCDDDVFALECGGMLPGGELGIIDGQFVIASPSSKPESGDIVVVEWKGGNRELYRLLTPAFGYGAPLAAESTVVPCWGLMADNGKEGWISADRLTAVYRVVRKYTPEHLIHSAGAK